MPQLSVTVTADEAREMQRRAAVGEETVSNYVRRHLGLSLLARGRSGRQNDEVTGRATVSRGEWDGQAIRRSQSEALLGRRIPVATDRPSSSPWTDEHAGEGYPPQSTDTGDDEPHTHELAYVEGDESP